MPYPTTLATPPATLLATLLENSPHGVIAYEAVRNNAGSIIDYRTLYYNPRVLAITAHTHEEMTMQWLFSRAPYARGQAEDLRRVVEEQITFDIQQLVPTLNRWFSFENRSLGDGFFTTIQDIDELKRTEQALEQQNIALKASTQKTDEQDLLLTSVLDTSLHSITVERAIRNEGGHVTDFRVMLMNKAAMTLAGYSEEHILNHPISQLNPQFDTSGLLAEYCTVLETGVPFNTDLYVRPLNKYLSLLITKMDADHVIVFFSDITQTQLDAKALQQKNELLDGILRTSESAIMVCEAVHDDSDQLVDFRVILTNEAAVRMGGRSGQVITGCLLSAINPKLKENGLWDKYRSVYETGDLFRGTHFYPNLGKWFDATISKLGNGIVATFNDISEVYAASRQIKEQAQLFQGVLDNISNGLSILKGIRDDSGNLIDFQYVTVSQAVLSDSDMSADQLIGQSMATLFPGVRQSAHWQALSAAFVTGKPQQFEAMYTYDGYDNYTANWITRLDEDRLISVYSIVNEQKQAESLAKQRSAILQSVLDGCQTAIVLFEAIRNPSGQIVDFRYLIQNEANARLLGYPIPETNSKTMLEVLPNLKASGIFDRYVAVTETGQPQQFEQQFSDGRVDGWFNISIVKQDDGIVVSASDLTLLHQTLEHTEQLVSELQHSNHNLEQFAYIASHDLQEPLRKIQSFGNLILDLYGQQLPEEGQMMLRRMQSAAERMSQLIRDLLAYSRLTGDKDSLVPVNLSKLITDIQTDLELVIREKKAQLTIQTDLDETLPSLSGNPMQLRQLFQNLLSNALKFVRPGMLPKISIRIQPITADEVPVTVINRAKYAWIRIEIKDDGIGFDTKYKEQIFQLFERLHGRSEYTGTGIGLAICRKVAENHGGTITAQSQVNEGAVFTVYLPR